jgi:ABC-type antimicrobial peptide transport system permease subunit
VPAIKQAVWRVDPSQPIQQVALVEHLLALSLTQDRFAVTLMATFALVALLLAAAGLYAVLAQIVLQRRQEIGIRLALGAHPGAVARLVASRGLVLTATGVAMGLALAWPASRALAAQLYGVQPHDPISFAAVPLALAGVAFVASWLPARRVLTVDPVTALRSE